MLTLKSPSRMHFQRSTVRLAQLSLEWILTITPLAVGVAIVVVALDHWQNVRLLGGFAPGRLIGFAAICAIAAFLMRHGPLNVVVDRRRHHRSMIGRLVAMCVFPIRGLLIGALMGLVLIRSFHPVRTTNVYVVIHIGDRVNDASFAKEMLHQCVQIELDHPHHQIDFSTPELKRLVAAAVTGKLKEDDPKWWNELKRQPRASTRLAELRDQLADRVGESVYVVAVERPSTKVQPWPIGPDRLHCKWFSVDPSQAPRADRTQLVSYCVNQDSAAAPYLYATLAIKPGEPIPTMVIDVGGPSIRVEGTGSFGDHHTYQAIIPRERAIREIRFEANGTRIPIDSLTGLNLNPRQLKVKVAPGLEAITALPLFRDQISGPIRFVDTGADVEWEASAGSESSVPSVELLSGKSFATAAPGYRLARTPAGVSCPLGMIALPKAGSEFKDLCPQLPNQPAKRLIDLAREPDAPVPFVFLRNAASTNQVTVVVPSAADMPHLAGNVPQSLAKMIVWATSLAYRAGKSEPPILLWELDSTDDNEAPAESGPPDEKNSVSTQLLHALNGRLDGNNRLAAGNSIRLECDRWAWLCVGLVLTFSASASVIFRIRDFKQKETV